MPDDVAAPGGFLPTQEEVRNVGSYGLARWRLPPPLTIHPSRSSSGVGALIQVGQSCVSGEQEVLLPPIQHDCLTFVMAHGPGHASARVGDARYDFSRGAEHAIAIPAGLDGHWVGANRITQILHVHVPLSMRQAVAPDLVFDAPRRFEPGETLHRLGAHFARCLTEDGPPSSLALESWACLILDGMRRRVPRASSGGLAPWQIARLTDYLVARLDQEVGLQELADLVGLTASYVCTAFRRSVGVPPHQWQIERRIEKAKALLAGSTQDVSQISLMVGYANPAHFATSFRKATGLAPRAWRRQHQS